MIGHTPGPWLLDEPGIGNDHVNGGGYHSITAGKGYYGRGPLGFEIQAFMDESDALLVTAAPDLLEALIDLVSGSGSSPGANKKYAKARRAIAKAKGEKT